MSQFESAIASWHDFYLAVASASAALLGLLFVGVSIGLAQVGPAARADMRIRAAVAFSNLSLVLILSLLLLIPHPPPQTLAIELAVVAAVRFVGFARRTIGLARSGGPHLRPSLATMRRGGWSVLGTGILAYVAYGLWQTADASLLDWLLFVVFVFMMGAAEVSWSLLVQVSEQTPAAREAPNRDRA